MHSSHMPASPQVRSAPHMHSKVVTSPGQHCALQMHSPLQTKPPLQVQNPSAQFEPAPQSLSLQHCVSGMHTSPHGLLPASHRHEPALGSQTAPSGHCTSIPATHASSQIWSPCVHRLPSQSATNSQP